MLYDAHNHWHDLRLAAAWPVICEDLPQRRVAAGVVNGTSEADWDAVAAMARALPWVRPSFGLHPWYAVERSPAWLERLEKMLGQFPRAGIGEIGLDRWIKGHDLADQTRVFLPQLALASERNLPLSIHCLEAWGALWDIVREHPLPERGFLLHAYSGPREMVRGFLRRGAYFSFPAYFLHERKAERREIFRELPADRILVETDAPDLAPPTERNRHPLLDPNGDAINHPANVEAGYAGLAEVRGVPLEEIEELVAANFMRWFEGLTKGEKPDAPISENL